MERSVYFDYLEMAYFMGEISAEKRDYGFLNCEHFIDGSNDYEAPDCIDELAAELTEALNLIDSCEKMPENSFVMSRKEWLQEWKNSVETRLDFLTDFEKAVEHIDNFANIARKTDEKPVIDNNMPSYEPAIRRR